MGDFSCLDIRWRDLSAQNLANNFVTYLTHNFSCQVEESPTNMGEYFIPELILSNREELIWGWGGGMMRTLGGSDFSL